MKRIWVLQLHIYTIYIYNHITIYICLHFVNFFYLILLMCTLWSVSRPRCQKGNSYWRREGWTWRGSDPSLRGNHTYIHIYTWEAQIFQQWLVCSMVWAVIYIYIYVNIDQPLPWFSDGLPAIKPISSIWCTFMDLLLSKKKDLVERKKARKLSSGTQAAGFPWNHLRCCDWGGLG